MQPAIRPAIAALAILSCCVGAAIGQPDDEPAALPEATLPAGEAADAAPPAGPDLGQRQQQLQRDFQRFEEELYKLSEVTRGDDPDRAELLIRARGQSREMRILDAMRHVAQLLQAGNELGDAAARQDELVANLQALLKLLQSEDERDRLSREIARYEDLLKDTGRLIGQQKDVRADTERRGDPGKLEGSQRRVADGAQQLADKIDRQDAERAAEAQSSGQPGAQSPAGQEAGGEPQEGEPRNPDESGMPGAREGEPSDDVPGKPEDPMPGESETPGPKEAAKPQEGEPSEGSSQPSEGTSQPSEATPSEGGSQSPSDSQSQSQSPSPSGSPSQGQSRPQQGIPPLQPPGSPQDSQQQPGGEQPPAESQNQTPGREDLEKAIEEMKQAIEELKKQQHDQASDEQDQALAELEQLKAKLEEILRQLREEEREMFLTMLEARFQNMLRLQLQINAETVRLDKVPSDQREARHISKATDLSRDQRDNALEADRALVLLKEEGSSVAFPEAVEQMRDNMITVARRLEQADTGETTQLIEQIIVETLDEMILALQKELEKLKEQQEQQQQQQQQQDQDPPLVDVLAELKMIRSLQNQVNRLTKQLGLQIEGEQALEPDAVQLLNDLSLRQQRIQEATYDLSTGKTSLGQQLRQGNQ